MFLTSGKQGFLLSIAFLHSWQVSFAQTTYEAENGSLNGVQVSTSQSGYSGSGFVTGFDAASDSVTFNVQSDSKKLYDVEIRYSSPNGEKYTKLSLNYGGGSDVRLAPTSSWAWAPAGQLLLNAGGNTISLTSNWGWYNIDALKLSVAAPPGAHQVSNNPVNPNANAAARSLYSFLKKNYGNHLISGQAGAGDLRWVEQNIGKTPAILGLDYGDYAPQATDHGTRSTANEDAIAFDNRGGIIAIQNHWRPPTGILTTPGKDWSRSFYADSTTFDIAAVMNNPNGNDYKLLVRDIDVFAEQLKKLQAQNIPILWRPLHEAEGGWFWWGSKGPEPCKKLWWLMYDRMTNYHKLNNLIWVWNSANPSWYPGDSTVDLVGIDSYPSQRGDHNPLSSAWRSLVSLVGDKKIICLPEVGEIPDPDLMQLYHTDWSWFATWGGEFINDGSHNSRDYLKSLYSKSYVLTLDEIQGWKSGGGGNNGGNNGGGGGNPVTTTAANNGGGGGGGQAQKYGQCGGNGWTGPTSCAGSTCQAVSPPWYYQCL